MNDRTKFSDYYLASGSRILSLIFGVTAGAVFALILGAVKGILIGAGIAILTSVLLPLFLYLGDRPYEKFKRDLPHPFLLNERVSFFVEGGTVGGFFVLSENQMTFLSLEKGKHIVKLSRAEVSSVVLEEDGSIRIFLNDTQFVSVRTVVATHIFEIIRENGWNAAEHRKAEK